MWCPAFHNQIFTRTFTTNNYVEGMNYALKSMLMLRPNLRVDSLWMVVVNNFTEHYKVQHMDNNLRDSGRGATWTRQKFPSEFGTRPTCVLKGLQDRLERAKKIHSSRVTTENKALGQFRFLKGNQTLQAEYDLSTMEKKYVASQGQPASSQQATRPPKVGEYVQPPPT